MAQDYSYPPQYHSTTGGTHSSTKKLSVKSSKRTHQNTNADIQSGRSPLPKWNDFNSNGGNDVNSANLIKVVVIGESGAGKSNLIQRLTEDRFDSRSKTTIGIDFALYEFEEPAGLRKVPNGKHHQQHFYKAQIWDTAGQERYRSSMTKIFYRDVAGAILVCDLTNRDHFFALNRWLDEIRSNVHHSADNPSALPAPHQIPIVLVGNKVDQTALRAIQQTEGVEFARRHRLAEYVETSAKTPTNVDKAFTLLFKHILMQRIRAEEEADAADKAKGKSIKYKGSRKVQRESSIKLGYTKDSTHNRANSHRSPPPAARQKKHSKCNC